MTPKAYCYVQKDISHYTFDEICAASKALTSGAFKLYIYFLMYEQSSFLFERTPYIEKCGGSVNAANRGFDELVEKGFLQQQNEKNFTFLKKIE